MTDLEKARALLADGSFGNCILYRNGTIHASHGKGIAPMLEFLEAGIDMTDFSAADTVVGKALAFLFVHAGVKEVYADVMSESAVKILSLYRVRHVHGELVEQIKNRAGNGICPMESAVENIEGHDEAYEILKAKYTALTRNTRR
ncbi:MAG: DUF1893 domain-containing protein [Oscillospiraceae bacterium]|nr:DUF1893 domain-containing protein [Oscillospiraceae bacterium]